MLLVLRTRLAASKRTTRMRQSRSSDTLKIRLDHVTTVPDAVVKEMSDSGVQIDKKRFRLVHQES